MFGKCFDTFSLNKPSFYSKNQDIEILLTSDQKKATAYNTAIGARESSVADRTGARESLIEFFNSADEMLNEEFDGYMEMLRTTETEFYNKYFAACVVKDTYVRHRPEERPTPLPAP